MNNQHVKDAIAKVVETLKTGNIENIAYAVFKTQRGYPSDSWSFLNRLVMVCSGTEDARGFAQWNLAGRRLKKGTKAIYIMVPGLVKTGSKSTNEEGEDEDDKRRIYMSKPVYAFEDTTGTPREEDGFKLEIPANLAQVAEGLGLEIKVKRYRGEEYGYFCASQKEIALMSPELEVYLHELAHAADAKINGKLEGGQQPKQEIVAELTAEVVGFLLGRKLNGRSRNYIQNYSGGSWKQVYSLLDRVNKVVSYIVDKAQIEEGAA